ncbi:hypothetical protein ACWC0C_37755 [Streptomyces sp. NPDC001709]
MPYLTSPVVPAGTLARTSQPALPTGCRVALKAGFAPEGARAR